MNRFDFGQAGGFPATQDRLAWMQSGYISGINAMGKLAGLTSPCSIIGVELTSGSWIAGGTVSNGWVFHPTYGVMEFRGGPFTPTSRTVSYTGISSSLVFGNGSLQNVQREVYAGCIPGSTNDIQALSETRWHNNFGKVARTAPVTLTDSNPLNGNSNVTVTYRKDGVGGIVYLTGRIGYDTAQSIPVNPLMTATSIQLPEKFRPSDRIIIPCFLRQYYPSGGAPATANGPILFIQGEINPDGTLAFCGIRPTMPTTAYSCQFSLSFMA